jgi:anaerobic selenocysteine-containing dehydrogenase
VQAGGEQYVTAEDSMGIVNRSKGREKPASQHLLSDVAIISRMARAVLKNRSTVDWNAMMSDYGKIREAISRVVPGFEGFSARLDQEGYFYLPNPARECVFMTPSRRAQLRACPTPMHDLQPGELLLMTLRSHDQFNSTIYGLDDRYRGVYGGRRVIFLNPSDMEELGLETGCLVDITSHFEGETRIAPRFIVVPYTISKRSAAAYYPETNVLVPIRSVAAKSNQPAYKCVRVTLKRVGSAAEVIKTSVTGIYHNLTRPDPGAQTTVGSERTSG